MVLKLHAHPMSPFAQKVMIVLAETKTPYELVLVDMQALGQKEPDYLAKNPFGTVPCMVSSWSVDLHNPAHARNGIGR
jgi:glutathione S-transferase